MELYKKYRPVDFSEMMGNEDVIKTIQTSLENKTFPHFVIFNGEAGCGKTTLCRILQKHLGVNEENYHEINASANNGVDFCRSIIERTKYRPLTGGNVLWVFDEAHQLSKSACESMLKPLEDTNSYTYFIFSSSEASKLPNAIKSRATTFNLKPLEDNKMKRLLQKVSTLETFDITTEQIVKIIDVAKGSSRTALVALDKIKNGVQDLNNLDNLSSNEAEVEFYQLFNALLYKKEWKSVALLLKPFNENAEGFRRYVISSCSNILLDINKINLYAQAFHIMTVMKNPFYDGGKSDLVRCCAEIIFGD